MDYNSVYLSRKEKRRFLEIANGDTKARNTPEEDALFRKGLVKESMIATIYQDTGYSTVDMRAVVLSDPGQDYFAQYRNQRMNDKKDTFRFWLTSIIAIAGLLVTVLGLLR